MMPTDVAVRFFGDRSWHPCRASVQKAGVRTAVGLPRHDAVRQNVIVGEWFGRSATCTNAGRAFVATDRIQVATDLGTLRYTESPVLGVSETNPDSVMWTEWRAHQGDPIEKLVIANEFALVPYLPELRALKKSLANGDEVADLELNRIMEHAGVPFLEWEKLCGGMPTTPF